jgi:hypothetical protein
LAAIMKHVNFVQKFVFFARNAHAISVNSKTNSTTAFIVNYFHVRIVIHLVFHAKMKSVKTVQ